MRRAAKVDDNQQRIVAVLRACGASVQSISSIGQGAPDLVVGIRGQNYLLELKDGEKWVSRQKLTPLEQRWHERWRGQVAVARDIDEALAVVGLRRSE